VTLLCTVERARRDWRRCARRGVPGRAHELEAGPLVLRRGTLDDVEASLRETGFAVEREGDAMHAVRGRFRPMWGSVFHVALLLTVGAFVLAVATTTQVGMELIEGQTAAQFFATLPERPQTESIAARLGDLTLRRIEPRFFGPYLLFQQLDATAAFRGKERTFALAQPLWIDPVTYVSVQDFNYAPRLVQKDAAGKVATAFDGSAGGGDAVGADKRHVGPANRVGLAGEAEPGLGTRDDAEVVVVHVGRE
jgi:hypothetical protein